MLAPDTVGTGWLGLPYTHGMETHRTARFTPAVTRVGDYGDSRWFVVRTGEVLLRDGQDDRVPLASHLGDLGSQSLQQLHLGILDDLPVETIAVGTDVAAPEGFAFVGLREAFGLLGEVEWNVAGRAVQLLEWDRTHRHCGACGEATEPLADERARRCPACRLAAFPRLSPAVIVAIERGDEILLARGPNFAPGRYALVAGFVEAGESLEDAVAREIREEVGIEVDQITYVASQPWPFPHSLMVGFFARYAGGEIRVDDREIEDARWFRAGALPGIPQRLSIARRLIDRYAAKHGVTLEDP